MKRIFLLLLSLFLCVSLATAAEPVKMEIDGVEFSGARLIGPVTYVPVRGFCETVAPCTATWNQATKTAALSGGGAAVTVGIGSPYIIGNGRYLCAGSNNILESGTTLVPVRAIAKVYGSEVRWDAQTRSVSIRSGGTPIASGDTFYNESEIYWLSRIISAESAGEPLSGKLAVGNVVLNRVKSKDFPNTVYDVIFDRAGGVQFSPSANGAIYNEPTEESVAAAKICIEGYRITEQNVMYFYNPTLSQSTWIPNNRDYAFSLGQHKFYV